MVRCLLEQGYFLPLLTRVNENGQLSLNFMLKDLALHFLVQTLPSPVTETSLWSSFSFQSLLTKPNTCFHPGPPPIAVVSLTRHRLSPPSLPCHPSISVMSANRMQRYWALFSGCELKTGITTRTIGKVLFFLLL